MSTKKAKNAETQSIQDYFAELPDPDRDNENNRHQLLDIIAIAILATICGAVSPISLNGSPAISMIKSVRPPLYRHLAMPDAPCDKNEH
jgi:hypothetical protein